MAGGEYHQHHFLLLLAATERLESIDDNVEYVERGPGEEEDDADLCLSKQYTGIRLLKIVLIGTTGCPKKKGD